MLPVNPLLQSVNDFIIAIMPRFGIGIVVLIFHGHCSLFIVIVNVQCCYNIVVGLVLIWNPGPTPSASKWWKSDDDVKI